MWGKQNACGGRSVVDLFLFHHCSALALQYLKDVMVGTVNQPAPSFRVALDNDQAQKCFARLNNEAICAFDGSNHMFSSSSLLEFL